MKQLLAVIVAASLATAGTSLFAQDKGKGDEMKKGQKGDQMKSDKAKKTAPAPSTGEMKGKDKK